MSGCGVNNLVYTTNSIMPCQHSIKTSLKPEKKEKKERKKRRFVDVGNFHVISDLASSLSLSLSLSKFYFTKP